MKIILYLILFSACGAAFSQEAEIGKVRSNSSEFDAAYEVSVQSLMDRNFGQNLQSASLDALSDPDAKKTLAEIVSDKPISWAMGEPGTHYDVILQPGHYLRPPGLVGTAGKLVSERALVAYIVGATAQELRTKNINVLVIAADKYHRGTPKLQTEVFLAVHADGSQTPCKTGPSLAYESNSSMMAMHAVGWGLGQALGYSYNDFKKDNFTVNEAKYYMFSQIDTKAVKGVLEIGELTCSTTEEELVVNANRIAFNLAKALEFVLGKN